jgi:hypothetical protein
VKFLLYHKNFFKVDFKVTETIFLLYLNDYFLLVKDKIKKKISFTVLKILASGTVSPGKQILKETV